MYNEKRRKSFVLVTKINKIMMIAIIWMVHAAHMGEMKNVYHI